LKKNGVKRQVFLNFPATATGQNNIWCGIKQASTLRSWFGDGARLQSKSQLDDQYNMVDSAEFGK